MTGMKDMKEKFATSAAVVICICLAQVGCDAPPGPPRTAEGRIAKTVAVTPGDAGELAAATALESARINYKYRMEVLRDYYVKIGNLDKHRWALRELKNLQQAQAFQWEGLPEITPPSGESIEGADERLLAEYAVSARNAYQAAVEELVGLYDRKDSKFKAALVRNIQQRFDPVHTYMYFLDAEIPAGDVRPVKVTPQADELFAKAYKLHRQGKLLPGLVDYPKQRKALMMFLHLVRNYGDSTKVALAAYYIADIYKEYFNENVRAVHWYRRAWQWDANITKPARFQAATIYDIRLHNFAMAVECYRLSLESDPPRLGNAATAQRRIKELTGQ